MRAQKINNSPFTSTGWINHALFILALFLLSGFGPQLTVSQRADTPTELLRNELPADSLFATSYRKLFNKGGKQSPITLTPTPPNPVFKALLFAYNGSVFIKLKVSDQIRPYSHIISTLRSIIKVTSTKEDPYLPSLDLG